MYKKSQNSIYIISHPCMKVNVINADKMDVKYVYNLQFTRFYLILFA